MIKKLPYLVDDIGHKHHIKWDYKIFVPDELSSFLIENQKKFFNHEEEFVFLT